MKSRLKTIIILSATTILLLTSCQPKRSQIMGDWVIDTSSANARQGFQLSNNGMAASINQPLVQYSSWTKHRHILILSGKRLENNQLSDFHDTLRITHLNETAMTLQQENTTIRLVRL